MPEALNPLRQALKLSRNALGWLGSLPKFMPIDIDSIIPPVGDVDRSDELGLHRTMREFEVEASEIDTASQQALSKTGAERRQDRLLRAIINNDPQHIKEASIDPELIAAICTPLDMGVPKTAFRQPTAHDRLETKLLNKVSQKKAIK